MKRAALLLALLPFLAGAALVQHYVLTRQRLQLRADAGAEHGAKAYASGRNVDEAVRKRLARFSPARPGDLIRVERPPSDGRFRDWPRAVRVRIRGPWSPPFIPRSLVAGLALDVSATAVSVPPAPTHPAATLRVE